jgi:large subunit ribosomal protein L17
LLGSEQELSDKAEKRSEARRKRNEEMQKQLAEQGEKTDPGASAA